jgi:raffinose/stachyose/melibiose transport system substrate-binding protein
MSLHLGSSPRSRALIRTLVAVSTIAAAAAALTGCSSGAGGADSKTVTFLSWDNQQTIKPVLDEFEKENPGYTVKASYAPPVPQYIQ